jgi:3-deoxy-D-manno-octulosonic acid kinase
MTTHETRVDTIRTRDGCWIRFDPTLIDQPSSTLFNPDWWRERGRLAGSAAGRGEVWFVENEQSTWALRHYRRGGLVGRINTDHYLYTGQARSRSFAELDVTLQLYRDGLPVPQPVAASMRRWGPWYTADLITVAIPEVETLTEKLLAESLGEALWESVGGMIRRFHQHGLNHADLNAHNILIDSQDSVWLIDFDKASLQPPGQWCEGNLSRLRRSLNKVARSDQSMLVEQGWRQLEHGYSNS